jgi:hypothetical protein
VAHSTILADTFDPRINIDYPDGVKPDDGRLVLDLSGGHFEVGCMGMNMWSELVIPAADWPAVEAMIEDDSPLPGFARLDEREQREDG